MLMAEQKLNNSSKKRKQRMSEIKTVMPLLSRDLIKAEVDHLILSVKNSLAEVKRLAINEAWKILQLATASIIQIIEKLGHDISSQDKKVLAMDLLNKFYDSVFVVVDIPVVPNFLEPIIHKYVKAFLMILVSATIDALVTTFRNTGVFLKKMNEGA
jgi:hypothetical protein